MKTPEASDNAMQNLATCLRKLIKSGYHTQFQITPQGLFSRKSLITFKTDEVKIAQCLRFNDTSDANNNSILYALETRNKEQGTLIVWSGIFSNTELISFMQNVKSVSDNDSAITKRKPTGKPEDPIWSNLPLSFDQAKDSNLM